MNKIFLALIAVLISYFGICQKIENRNKISGVYVDSTKFQKITILPDNSFYYTRILSDYKPHLVTPLCDTMAKGKWRLFTISNLILANNVNFNATKFNVAEDTKGSKDSIYFNILLPHEDALNHKKFEFSIFTHPAGKIIKSEKTTFSIAKKEGKLFFYSFDFSITCMSPNNCNPGEKCYQRIYFNIFDDYMIRNSENNFFTISLPNFNQCFYEAMDIENEIIVLKQNKIFWRGKYFKRIR